MELEARLKAAGTGRGGGGGGGPRPTSAAAGPATRVVPPPPLAATTGLAVAGVAPLGGTAAPRLQEVGAAGRLPPAEARRWKAKVAEENMARTHALPRPSCERAQPLLGTVALSAQPHF